METVETRPPLPPFDREAAALKVRLAEDGWNSRNPKKVALAYSIDSRWQRRFASINDLPIRESDRKFRCPLGRRPDDHPGLSELGL